MAKEKKPIPSTNAFLEQYAHLPQKYHYKAGKIEEFRLGQALIDLNAQSPTHQTVEETRNEMSKGYLKELLKCVETGSKLYKSPFYVMVFRKKNTLGLEAVNVMDFKYLPRQTSPLAETLIQHFGHWDIDLYKVDKENGELSHVYTLPSGDTWGHYLHHPDWYAPELLQWIKWAQTGKLEEETKTGQFDPNS